MCRRIRNSSARRRRRPSRRFASSSSRRVRRFTTAATSTAVSTSSASESGSDSATLDNCLRFLAVNGRSLPHAVLMLVPEAWQNNALMDPDLKAFYEYHACLMEPWDGPASIAFTNGSVIGAVLDRNGLRPSRYYVTKDNLVIMASEVGALPVEPANVAKKWRLQPGENFLVDMQKGKIVDDNAIKRELVDKRPWRRGVGEKKV